MFYSKFYSIYRSMFRVLFYDSELDICELNNSYINGNIFVNLSFPYFCQTFLSFGQRQHIDTTHTTFKYPL